eukprot:scaffold208572_cov39-Tisochrysis_lutea.AAC.1
MDVARDMRHTIGARARWGHVPGNNTWDVSLPVSAAIYRRAVQCALRVRVSLIDDLAWRVCMRENILLIDDDPAATILCLVSMRTANICEC